VVKQKHSKEPQVYKSSIGSPTVLEDVSGSLYSVVLIATKEYRNAILVQNNVPTNIP
jgi:hypothetical protein